MILAGPVQNTDQLDQGNEDSVPVQELKSVLPEQSPVLQLYCWDDFYPAMIVFSQMKKTTVKSCLQFPFAPSGRREVKIALQTVELFHVGVSEDSCLLRHEGNSAIGVDLE